MIFEGCVQRMNPASIAEMATLLITINWAGQQITVSPEPATVQVGTTVLWRLRPTSSPVRCIVEFAQQTPFANAARRFQIDDGSQDAAPVGGLVEQEGQYKYSVAVHNAGQSIPLAEDDPHLIVKANQ
jgi:hypothetical protein